MIKELWTLAKMLFHRTKNSDDVEVLLFKHFPFKGYSMMMWCGKLITRQEKYLNPSVTTLRHEKIHLKQAQMYSHWYKYYLRYLWEWIKGNPITHPSHSAYYTIPFEMEAYGNEYKIQYNPTKETLKCYTIKNRKKTYKANRNDWKKYCKKINMFNN